MATTINHRYALRTFDAALPPKGWEHAHYGRDGWEERGYTCGRQAYHDGSYIDLLLMGYDGATDEAIESFESFPLRKLLEARPGAWMVPTNIVGAYEIYQTKAEAQEAILALADKIWRITSQAPGIEAIRLEGKEELYGQTLPILRMYHFWFANEGEVAYADMDHVEGPFD